MVTEQFNRGITNKVIRIIKKLAKRFLRLKNRLESPKGHNVSEIDWILRMYNGKPNGTMVDVGAHFGESFKPFADLGWTILAFEPDNDPAKMQAIEQNFNSTSRLYNCALSDSKSKETNFYRSALSTGISGIIPFHESHEFSTKVEMDTLKSVLEREDVSNVDFLKIDTEGNDLLVLKGLDWYVRPTSIICEFEDAKTKHVGYDYRALGDFLLKAGYAVYTSEWHPITKYGAVHKWRALRKYPCELSDPCGWGNFIAIVPAKQHDFLASVSACNIKISTQS